MAKTKSRFVCQECGFQTARYLGRCTECQTWGSLVEEFAQDEDEFADLKGELKAQAKPLPLDFVSTGEAKRINTGISQLDLVLGGGLVSGSIVLLAGDPGIGKSTLLLQLAKNINQPILYISGEESTAQIKLRAERLGLKGLPLLLCQEQNVKAIVKHLQETESKVAIIDSIQAVFHPDLSSAPGSVAQVRESAHALICQAKEKGIATIFVGHVTKDGALAGPKVLEHMVDVVLQFEGDRLRQVRILRAIKNRFGSTAEIGLFQMGTLGLLGIDNPSALFLGDRLSRLGQKQAPSGTAVLAGAEGNSVLLVEVQALVGTSPYPSPRRVGNGFDGMRLLQILAVLEKRVGLSLSKFDVYLNVVGGFEFSDPAGDLGVAVALSTSYLDRSSDPAMVFIGEIGLAGEVRPVSNIERRVREAKRLGFTRILVPKQCLNELGNQADKAIIGVEYLIEALELAIPQESFGKKQKAVAKERPPHEKSIFADLPDNALANEAF